MSHIADVEYQIEAQEQQVELLTADALFLKQALIDRDAHIKLLHSQLSVCTFHQLIMFYIDAFNDIVIIHTANVGLNEHCYWRNDRRDFICVSIRVGWITGNSSFAFHFRAPPGSLSSRSWSAGSWQRHRNTARSSRITSDISWPGVLSQLMSVANICKNEIFWFKKHRKRSNFESALQRICLQQPTTSPLPSPRWFMLPDHNVETTFDFYFSSR